MTLRSYSSEQKQPNENPKTRNDNANAKPSSEEGSSSHLSKAKPVFTTPWTCLDDRASLYPLDCESTTTAKLFRDARLDYAGTTTRVDLID